MAWEEIGNGNPLELYGGMAYYDRMIPEGGRAMLQLNLRLPVSSSIARQIENALKAAGVPGVRVTTASPILKVYFTKGFPWLVAIVGVLLTIAVLAILIVSWQLFKEIGPVSTSLMMIAGIGAVAIAGIMLLRRKPT